MRIEEAIIISNDRIASGIWRMRMNASLITQEIRGPGQFVNIAVSDSWDLPLRRPMSIAGVEGSHLEIIYKVFGEGTRRLSSRKTGERINILGPLGNTFDLFQGDGLFPILVGGGVGIAPIQWMHSYFEKEHVEHDMIVGAATAEEHFMEHQPSQGIFLTTDDGTKGDHGTVMPTLERRIEERENAKIFACGPEPMLKAIHEFVTASNFSCQMALESYMACGTGICQGCVVEWKNASPKQHSYNETYSLVCCDGPVYDAHEVII